jgi:hypothetical protein
MNFKKALKTAISACFRPHDAPFLENPVFVVACGRSGSTALCNALGKDPRIFMANPEGPLVHRIGEIAYHYAIGPVSKYYQYSIQFRKGDFRHSLKHMCYASAFGDTLGFDYNPLNIRMSNSVFRGRWRYQFWGAKVFPNKMSAEGLLWLYPNAKMIYLFRNGLDVVHSMSKFGKFAKREFEERCRFWCDRVFIIECSYMNISDFTIEQQRSGSRTF